MPVRIMGFIIFLLSAIPLSQAEEIGMPAHESAGTTIAMPVNGMSMMQVEQQYGQPTERKSPVGEPPITRWLYETFTVYFEHQHVIHSVVDP